MGELVSLRVALLSQDEVLRRNIAAGAARVPVPMLVENTGDAAASGPLPDQPADIVLLHDVATTTTTITTITTITAAPPHGPGRPLVLALGAASAAARHPRIDGGVDGVVPVPGSVTEAADLLGRCARLCMVSRILVVDDSPTMRGIVRRILEASRFRFEIEEAGDGMDALRRIQTTDFDYVLVDYNMPGLSGGELLARIKLAKTLDNVVAMTASPHADLRERVRRAGVAAFLGKPFYPADIEAILLRHRGIAV